MLLTLMAVLSLLTGVGVCLLADLFATWLWLLWLPLVAAGAFLGLLLLALLFLLAVTAPLKPDAVYEKDSRFYRTLTGLYIELIIPLAGLRFEVKGMEKRPESGRFLLVCNHLHEIDPGVLMHFFPRSQLAFVAKREVAEMPIVKGLLPKLLSPYINRENDREALKTILRCIHLLKEDRASVGIFPEGYINQQRKLKHFRPGVFKIAQKAGVPIVVCTLRNTHTVLPRLLKGKRTTVPVHLLEVIEPGWLEGKTTTEIAEYVYGLMAEDLGPENCYREENT